MSTMNSCRKAQRRVCDFFLSKYGLTLCCVALAARLLFIALFSENIPIFDFVEIRYGRYAGNIRATTQQRADNDVSNDIPSIDIVYTWVNGSDSKLISALEDLKRQLAHENEEELEGDIVNENYIEYDEPLQDIFSPSRFSDKGELRYSLRSIERFAPWVRHIYIVTNGQIPSWLNLDNPKISVVSHKDIFVNQSHLPTFSSPSIESHLHRIPGLSKHFIYMNDDILLVNKVVPDDFYTQSKGQKIYLSFPIPPCAEGCMDSWLEDGFCDRLCNVQSCEYDAGDCNITSISTLTTTFSPNNDFDWGAVFDKYCQLDCPTSWLGNNDCDATCNNEACGMDAGDCGLNKIYGTVYGFNITASMLQTGQAVDLRLPVGRKSVYINVDQLMRDYNAIITSVSHSNPDAVLYNTTFEGDNMILFVLHKDLSCTLVSVSVDYSTPLTEGIFTLDLYVQTMFSQNPNERTCMKLLEGGFEDKVPLSKETQVQTKKEKQVYTVVGNKDKRTANHKGDEHFHVQQDIAGEFDNTGLIGHVTTTPERLPQDFEKDLSNRTEYTSTPHTGQVFERLNHIINEWSLDKTAPLPPKTEIDHNGLDGINDMSNITDRSLRREHDYIKPQLNFHPKRGIKTRGLVDIAANEVKMELEGIGPRFLSVPHPLEESDETSLQGDLNMGVLPRKKKETIKAAKNAQFVEEQDDSTDGFIGQPKLLDKFGDSLRHVDRLYTQHYGKATEVRRTIAHMPHYMDRDIIMELQARFPTEFEATSSHKIRHSKDMQYAFSYMYYVMVEPADAPMDHLWNLVDTDDSGTLSKSEVRMIALLLYPTPLDDNQLHHLYSILIDCGNGITGSQRNMNQRAANYESVTITKEVFTKCGLAIAESHNTTVGYKKYRHEVVKVNDGIVLFHMLKNNVKVVKQQLDEVLKKRPQFVCLNDDIDYSLPSAEQVVYLLNSFHTQLFPLPSAFELPNNQHNAILDVEEWRAQHKYSERFWKTFRMVAMVVSILVVITLMALV